ncbi:hypothetical protein BJX62DRAFT_119064 [Aspergillus germanicus]
MVLSFVCWAGRSNGDICWLLTLCDALESLRVVAIYDSSSSSNSHSKLGSAEADNIMGYTTPAGVKPLQGSDWGREGRREVSLLPFVNASSFSLELLAQTENTPQVRRRLPHPLRGRGACPPQQSGTFTIVTPSLVDVLHISAPDTTPLSNAQTPSRRTNRDGRLADGRGSGSWPTFRLGKPTTTGQGSFHVSLRDPLERGGALDLTAQGFLFDHSQLHRRAERLVRAREAASLTPLAV